MNLVAEAIKNAVKTYLEEHNITEEAFAEAIGHSPEGVKYLLSENSTVGSGLLEKFCATYDVEPVLTFPKAVEQTQTMDG